MITFSQPYFLLVGILALPALYLAVTREPNFKKITAFTKALTVLLIAFALASPSLTVSEERSSEDKVVILEDNSRSTEIMHDTDLQFEDIKVEKRNIASGNSSDLSSGILQNIDKDKTYLLISDLQSSSPLDQVPDRVNERNSTLNILKPEFDPESSVKIKGPETTYPGAKNTFDVKVSSTEENIPKPQVTLNDEPVEIQKTEGDGKWQLTETFDDEGYNTIEASVASKDNFRDNNRYYKSVKVAEKPEILVLGEKGRISQEFSDFYSFEYRDEIPDDLSPYYAVIAKKNFNEADLASYTAEGNGLIYTAELKEENSVLPIRNSEYEDQGIKMMLLIDASQGSGGECAEGTEEFCFEREEEGGALERTQKISYLLLDSDTLPSGSKVGALYYNKEPHLISKPKPLGENNHREKLQGGITNIPTGGNTLHYRAIKAGQEIIDGEGNLMLISDGEVTALGDFNNDTRNSRELAENSEERIISVRVGENPNSDYLNEIASLSGGYSISDVKSQEIKFQGGGSSADAVSLIKNNENHFITSGISVEGSTSGFYGAEPKPGAKQLVSGTNSEPFLTVWRYGIGRVAAFSGGEKDLGATMYRDSELVSKTLSWTVGEPQRKENNTITIEDGQVGEAVKVEANYPANGLKRQGENRYTGELETEDTGFHSFNDAVYSYNYNDEVENIGYSGDESIAHNTGGKVFTPDQKDEIRESVQQFNSREVKKQRDVSVYFLATALLVFLSEIGYRKRRGKK
ncbi:MAG: hypothetical protein BRC26_00265 [Nanohaloarchaea archaeon QH_8_44_6]|nr:MAG: hypothetical protein BRC26_00265 [Nanohaloarchaea archaeon QH_8_44_6]